MILNLNTLNTRGLKNPSKCVRFLVNFRTLVWMLLRCKRLTSLVLRTLGCYRTTTLFFSAYDSRNSVGVSLLTGRSLNADVNLVFVGDRGFLVVVDVTVKRFEFRVAAIYANNIAAESVSFFRLLAPFFDNPK